VAFRLRVAAAFFVERDRAAAGRPAEALPPPVSLLTVAQAHRSAAFLPTPRCSYPFSMCSAWRFYLPV
jgi:hypothetical protein